jgi:DNA-binding IclR family transcriptional regulator
MQDGGSNETGIKSLATGFRICEMLADADGATVTEVASETGLAKSTAHEHLQTMVANEFVTQSPDGSYELSLRFLDFGKYVQNQRAVTDVAGAVLEQLAADTGETVWLVVEEHGWGVYLMRATGENAFRIQSRVGERSHLHCLAAGKALLAALDADRVDEIVDRRGLPEFTPNTTTDRDALADELERIRDREVAFNENEEIQGVRGVGASIVAEGDLHGAVGIGGPENRMRGEYFREELPNMLLGATNEIELRLAYS